MLAYASEIQQISRTSAMQVGSSCNVVTASRLDGSARVAAFPAREPFVFTSRARFPCPHGEIMQKDIVFEETCRDAEAEPGEVKRWKLVRAGRESTLN